MSRKNAVKVSLDEVDELDESYSASGSQATDSVPTERSFKLRIHDLPRRKCAEKFDDDVLDYDAIKYDLLTKGEPDITEERITDSRPRQMNSVPNLKKRVQVTKNTPVTPAKKEVKQETPKI